MSQYLALLKQSLGGDFRDPERLISPLLFALTMLLLFTFTFIDTPVTRQVPVYVAQSFMTGFFAIQISVARVFELDRDDRVFDLIRTYPVSASAWYFAKLTHLVLVGWLIGFSTMVLAALFLENAQFELNWVPFAAMFVAVIALSALGVLLSAITLKARGRQLLYPILFFPLATPVLLAAIESSRIALSVDVDNSSVWSWLGLLAGTGVIGVTLGWLLFAELIEDI